MLSIFSNHSSPELIIALSILSDSHHRSTPRPSGSGFTLKVGACIQRHIWIQQEQTFNCSAPHNSQVFQKSLMAQLRDNLNSFSPFSLEQNNLPQKTKQKRLYQKLNDPKQQQKRNLDCWDLVGKGARAHPPTHTHRCIGHLWKESQEIGSCGFFWGELKGWRKLGGLWMRKTFFFTITF